VTIRTLADFHGREAKPKITHTTKINKKLIYRKDDRAMRHMYMGALKIVESLSTPTATFNFNGLLFR